MTPLTELIIQSGNADRILSVRQLERLLGGSDARRYGQVNRSLKSGELIQARRGLYLLSNSCRSKPAHPFVIAQQMLPGSYISAETALAFHGWIPEAVHSVLSIVPKGRSLSYEHKGFGKFEFQRMAVMPGHFLQAVERHELNKLTALIAEPVRALLDLVYLRKLTWQDLDYLIEGFRIDEQAITAVPATQISRLLDVYKGKRQLDYIKKLLEALGK